MRTSRAISSIFAAALLLCLATPAARAAETETHILNEALSLTGSCETSSLDMVPDPGCPGGAHPPGPLANPSSVSTDSYGDIYIASAGFESPGAHVDVFTPSGKFLTELAVPGARVIAVGSSGSLYVGTFCVGGSSCAGAEFLRFDPTKYAPDEEEIEYGDPPVELPQPGNGFPPGHGYIPFPIRGLAVNPINQHLFATDGGEIMEFGPPVPGEPNVLIEGSIGGSVLGVDEAEVNSVALDVAHGLLYAAQALDQKSTSVVRVFELAPPHALVRTIDGSTTPQGEFITNAGLISIAPEEATGNVFVSDIYQGRRLYEFAEDGSYVTTFEHGFESLLFNYIHVDNSPESPNQSYLFVPSGFAPPGHTFAYQPKPPSHPPVIESVSVSGVGEREALAEAVVNPAGSATHYVFEYTPQERFEAEEFSGALTAGEGNISSGIVGVGISAPLAGLSPGTTYRFRVRAESLCLPEGCGSEEESSFTTFASPLQEESCGNAALRMGASAALPDCRVYELVTPSNTNGRSPRGPESAAGPDFGTAPLRSDGNALAFRIEGGPIPGTNGTGSFNGDAYLTTRTPSGWRTDSQSPTGEQNALPSPGGLSPDLAYIAWRFGGDLGGPVNTSYVRAPDGTFHLVGEGTLTNDLLSELHYISPGGSHIIFTAHKRLVPAAPEGSTAAIYDRTSDGVLHVVSLLPGDVTPSEEFPAEYVGRSDNGADVAFKVGGSGPIYVRVGNSQTLVASAAGGTFAGFSAGGRYLFYVDAGDFFRFDVQTQETVEITRSGDAEPVNIAAEGSSAYFISLKKLSNVPNPNGAKALAGRPNLYRWDGSANQFVATVTLEDVEGESDTSGGAGHIGGFSEWMKNLSTEALGSDPTRSTAQGSILLFRSRANLTSYDSDGHAELYRYDGVGDTLTCISCNSTGLPPSSDANLISASLSPIGGKFPLNRAALVPNLSEDGNRAFFESSERLVTADNDGLQDVYEWEAEGKGSCRQPGGCVFLISSGQSGRPNYLFGVSASGDDVAFSTSDLLTADDPDETASVYDARVGGGFAGSTGKAGECLGEACQPAATAPPAVTPASSIFRGSGNVKEGAKPCPKGKHLKRVRGKSRCVKKRALRHAKHRRKLQSHRHGRSAR